MKLSLKKRGNMVKNYIIISSLIACISMYFIEQAAEVNYAAKTLTKILLFIIIPVLYNKFFRKSALKGSINYKKLDKQHIKTGFLFGIVSFAIILFSYYLSRNFIDLVSIAEELQNKSKITPVNFVFVGLYITFGNSLLEEFFFRGFIFLNLYELKFKKIAYIYSSLLFGLYHITIFRTWFNTWLMGLALAGLIIIGFIFDWLDTKSENFVNSWMVHIFADSAIILIGLKMFKII